MNRILDTGLCKYYLANFVVDGNNPNLVKSRTFQYNGILSRSVKGWRKVQSTVRTADMSVNSEKKTFIVSIQSVLLKENK